MGMTSSSPYWVLAWRMRPGRSRRSRDARRRCQAGPAGNQSRGRATCRRIGAGAARHIVASQPRLY